MARPASGTEHIDAARELLRTAKTADELRRAQAVLLPLTLEFSMQQIAATIGRSVGATCSMRTRFLAVHEGRRAAARSKRELRNRASTPLQEEARVLDEVFSGAAEGQVLVVPQLKTLIDQQLGKTIIAIAPPQKMKETYRCKVTGRGRERFWWFNPVKNVTRRTDSHPGLLPSRAHAK